MKISAAFCALIATIGTAPCAHARLPSLGRDPRTVEVKDDVRRITMGEEFLKIFEDELAGNSGFTCEQLITKKKDEKITQSLAENANPPITDQEAKSLACSAVTDEYEECRGCQGYTRVGKTSVLMPACVGMSTGDCLNFAKRVVEKHGSEWFKDPNMDLTASMFDVYSGDNTYYALALPVSEAGGQIKGISKDGDCMVNYPWDWCINNLSNHVECIKIGPFDCKDQAGGCLKSDACCKFIQDNQYPAPDINSNRLQCYEWVIPNPITVTSATSLPVVSKASQGSVPDGMVGSHLIMHHTGGTVKIPAVIADENYGVDQSQDKGIMAHQPLTVGPITVTTKDGTTCMEKDENDNVMMDTCGRGVDQQFYYDAVTMTIRYHDNINKCLDYNEGNSHNVRMYTCHGGDTQKWHMTETNALKTFSNEHCLDMNTNNANLYMNSCHKEDNQKFVSQIPISRDGAIKSEDGTKCMKLDANDNNNVLMNACDSNDGGQYFHYDVVTMAIRSHGKCLDYNYSNDNVELNADCHGDPNQKWYMTKNNELKTKHDEKCLDINNGDGDNLYMSKCHGESNQKFESDIPITAG